MTYRVFVGMWDEVEPGWVHVDVAGLSWDAARSLLADHLNQYKDDDCEHCRSVAGEALARLQAAKPGAFEADVDGDDYLILCDLTGNKP